METQKLVAKIQKKLSKELSDWANNPQILKSFYEKPLQKLQAYISNEEESSVLGLYIEKLFSWHLGQYTYLALNKKEYHEEHILAASLYAASIIEIRCKQAEIYNGGSMLLKNAAAYISLIALTGADEELNKSGRYLIDALNTSALDLKKTERHDKGEAYRHFWFLIELIAKITNQEIDTSLYSHPADMSPYQAALNNWKTESAEKILEYTTNMADFHINESQDSTADRIFEFEDENFRLFPHEILCYLKLRERSGLSNPTSINHPLMQQPLAEFPNIDVAQRTSNPLLDAVMKKFRNEH